MKFKNPANGHIESVSLPWLWSLLFGGLYLIAAGLWAPLLIWLVLTVAAFASMGPAAMVLVIVMNVIYAALSSGWVRSSYLRKGWVEVKPDEKPVAPPAAYSEPYRPPSAAAAAAADTAGLSGHVEIAVAPAADTAPNAVAPMATADETRRCPYCAEDIRVAAIKCKHCGSMIEPVTQGSQA